MLRCWPLAYKPYELVRLVSFSTVLKGSSENLLPETNPFANSQQDSITQRPLSMQREANEVQLRHVPVKGEGLL
jgi:hypothetical protein